jgi:putative membrane protein
VADDFTAGSFTDSAGFELDFRLYQPAPGTWDQAVADFVARVRAGRIAEGFLAAIAVVGDRLAEHFPRAPDDIDELPNRLIEI